MISGCLSHEEPLFMHFNIPKLIQIDKKNMESVSKDNMFCKLENIQMLLGEAMCTELVETSMLNL